MTLAPVSERRTLITVLLLSALVKAVYVFGLTDYPSHVFSDSAHYYQRALAFLAGNAPTHVDWDVYPLGSSVLLALFWKALGLIGFGPSLESALLLNIAASTVMVALLWRLARCLTGAPLLALGIAAGYSVFYPLVYLNAFTLSEGPAQLFFMCSVWAMVEAHRTARPTRWVLLAGLSWALACHCRGNFLALAPAYALALLALGESHLAAVRRVLSFAAAAGLVFGMAALTLWWASDGATAHATGNNGGFNFFMQQCHLFGARSIAADYTWGFYPPVFQDQPELGIHDSAVPIADQSYYYQAGVNCILHDPGSVARLVAMAPALFYGVFYPTYPSAAGFATAMAISRHLNLALVLLSAAGAVALWRRRRRETAFLLLGAGLSTLTFVLFNADHRHLYSLAFLYWLFGLTGLRALLAAEGSVRARYAGAAAMITLAGWWLFRPVGPLSLKAHRPVHISAERIAHPVADGTPSSALEALRFWAPLTIALPERSHAEKLEIALDGDDTYELSFWKGDQRLAVVRLALAPQPAPPKGLINRKLDLPDRVRGSGFDTLQLTPISGDGRYGVAGLVLKP